MQGGVEDDDGNPICHGIVPHKMMMKFKQHFHQKLIAWLDKIGGIYDGKEDERFWIDEDGERFWVSVEAYEA